MAIFELHPALESYMKNGAMKDDSKFASLLDIWRTSDQETQIIRFLGWLEFNDPAGYRENQREYVLARNTQRNRIANVTIPDDKESLAGLLTGNEDLLHDQLPDSEATPIEVPRPHLIDGEIQNAQQAADIVTTRIPVYAGTIERAVRNAPAAFLAALTAIDESAERRLLAKCHAAIRAYSAIGSLRESSKFRTQIPNFARAANDKQGRLFARWLETENPGELQSLIAQGKLPRI